MWLRILFAFLFLYFRNLLLHEVGEERLVEFQSSFLLFPHKSVFAQWSLIPFLPLEIQIFFSATATCWNIRWLLLHSEPFYTSVSLRSDDFSNFPNFPLVFRLPSALVFFLSLADFSPEISQCHFLFFLLSKITCFSRAHGFSQIPSLQTATVHWFWFISFCLIYCLS